MYLITFKYDDEFAAEFMHMWQIANVYGFSDCNGATDFKVYRLSPDKDPERLYIHEENHCIALFTATGEQVTEYEDWAVH